ncbi:MAG: hypothetical protein RXN88_00310 [Acidilobus sp.]|jgi:hypothetical protein
MLSLVVNETPWDDVIAERAAFSAAEILRREYSLMILVEINSDLANLGSSRDGPSIVIGAREIKVDQLKPYESLINEIVEAALENAATNGIESLREPSTVYIQQPTIAA